MNLAVHVGHGVINNLMLEFPETFIRFQRIGIQSGTGLNVFADFGLKCLLFSVWNNLSANLATPLLNPHDSGFIFAASTGDLACSFASCIFRAFPPMKVSSASTSPESLSTGLRPRAYRIR